MSTSLQESKVGWSSQSQYRRSSRRNRAEDLEKEVELIMSQEDDSDIEMDIPKENKIPVTPKSNKHGEKRLESSSVVKNNTLLYTPRRSSRKSIKPVQEYEDIVSYKRQLRSTLKVGEEIDKEKEEEGGNMKEQQPRWTPAKVGRVSQKRGRKSRKTAGDKNKSKLKSSSESEDTTDVNKEYLQSNEVIESLEENINEPGNIKEIASNVEKSEVINIVNMEEKAKEITNKEENVNVTNTEDVTKEKEHEKEVINIEAEVKDSVIVQELKEKIINVEDNAIGNIKQHEENKKENVNEKDSIGHEKLEEGITEVKEEKSEDSFGTYLKNNILDISDLGLNPLTEENVVNDDLQEMKDRNCNIAGTEENGKRDIQVVTINDDTFNSSDCIMLNAEQADDEDEMQPLQLSDDEISKSPPHKTPCIILTTDEGVDQKLNLTASLIVGSTPKRCSQTAKRMPTPYKKNTDISIMEDGIDQKWEAEPPVTIELSKLEPKEIVLRSIRKRSFSVCIGGAEADTKRKNVTFYSPANQTAVLEDLDVRMIQSVKKNVDLKSANTETFITQRRKRSLSFDEAMINKSKYRSQTPSKMGVTPQKIKPIRTKLPNFAAIHLKNFEKMENLVDHVNRKAERAKLLTNSASKERVASAQKPAKPHQASFTTTNPDKSKAAKRINLHTSVNSTFAGANTTFDTSHKDLHNSKLPIPRIGVCKPLVTTENSHKENREVKLPNPRLGIIKPQIITFANNKNKQVTPAKNALKPTQTRQAVRPAFNLSTALESHANYAKSANTTGVQITNAAVTKANAQTTNTAASTISVDEKMASRRQRHMDMFKGRAANTRTTPGTAEKRYGQLIRGVRSNRRFELQMAHRKNMEH